MSVELNYSLSGISAAELNKELDQLWTEALADDVVRQHLQTLGENPSELQAINRNEVIEIRGTNESGLDPLSAIVVALLCGAAKKIGEKSALYLWDVIVPRLQQDKGSDSLKRRK